jgi:molybdate transport system substrate-binding protein
VKATIVGWVGMMLAGTMAVSGCSGASESDSRDVVVSAAASLSDVFRDMEASFERVHPEFDVLLNIGGSAALREQILEGAPADVFASANVETMDEVLAGGEVEGTADIFAENHMVIAVPAGNPGAVVGLEDFARTDLFVGLCAKSVPCGAFARQILASADVDPSVDSNEPNVRSLLLKIGLGEIDAGIVYVTDAISAAGLVDSITVPVNHDVTAEYPIALLASAPNPAGGEAFIRFVTSAEGAAILEDHGFELP